MDRTGSNGSNGSNEMVGSDAFDAMGSVEEDDETQSDRSRSSAGLTRSDPVPEVPPGRGAWRGMARPPGVIQPVDPPGDGAPRSDFPLHVDWDADAAGVNSEPDEDRLAQLAGSVGPLRRVLAAVTARLIDTKAYERLCYARLSDYARERAGLSARQLQELAKVHRALVGLPGLERTLVEGVLPWSKVRLLARVATAVDEEAWIARARAVSTRRLEAARPRCARSGASCARWRSASPAGAWVPARYSSSSRPRPSRPSRSIRRSPRRWTSRPCGRGLIHPPRTSEVRTR
jgi:hypothetical protein